MKLTKHHIFIIILIALILCPTLGACSVEGYVQNQTFSSYSAYDSNLDNQTISENRNSQNYSSNPVSGSSSTPPGKAPSKAPGIFDKFKAIISSKPNTATTTVTPSSNSNLPTLWQLQHSSFPW